MKFDATPISSDALNLRISRPHVERDAATGTQKES